MGYPSSISDHADSADAQLRRGFGPRVRKLHARIGKAHHKAEGMAFSRSLLQGEATPIQIAGLMRALLPAYSLLEDEAPTLASALGAESIPWSALARRSALEHDIAVLSSIDRTPLSAAGVIWHEHLKTLVRQAPHRLMAHVYVRYGGDLSGGQQLAEKANAIISREGLSPLSFWSFEQEVPKLKQALHDGFEEMDLSEAEEEELLEEAEVAFGETQRLLAELADLH